MKYPIRLDKDLIEKGRNRIENIITNFPRKPTPKTDELYSEFQDNCIKICKDVYKKQTLRNSEGLVEKIINRIFQEYRTYDFENVQRIFLNDYEKGTNILKERGFRIIIISRRLFC